MAKSIGDIRHFKNFAHRDRILRKIPIIHSRLEKGMVVVGNYTPKSDRYKRKKLDSPHDYLLLILNKNWEGFVHAINIDAFPPNKMDWLAEQYGLRYIYHFQKTIGLDIPKMQQDKTSKMFYDEVLRKLVNVYPKCYRRMHIENFAYYQLVDYNFPEELKQKYLYGLGVEEDNIMTIDKADFLGMSKEQREFIESNKYKGLKREYKGIPKNKQELKQFKEDVKSNIDGDNTKLYTDETINDRISSGNKYDDSKSKQDKFLENKDFIKNIKKKK